MKLNKQWLKAIAVAFAAAAFMSGGWYLSPSGLPKQLQPGEVIVRGDDPTVGASGAALNAAYLIYNVQTGTYSATGNR